MKRCRILWPYGLLLLAVRCGDGVAPNGLLAPVSEASEPYLCVLAPVNGEASASPIVRVHGEVSPDVDRVSVKVDKGEAQWAALAEQHWEVSFQLPPGVHRIEVEAHFLGWAKPLRAALYMYQGRTIRLAALPGVAPEIELRLDRLALGSLLSPEAQEEIIATTIDLRPLVEQALAALAAPEAWGVDTSTWGPAERHLADLLAMGPDTADVSETALAPLMDLSARLGLPPPRVLSELIDVAPSDPFLSPDTLAETLMEHLMWTHPNWRDAYGKVLDNGLLRVSLADVLADLATLGDRFGPCDGHPGFMAGPPRAQLFTPAFAMVLRGRGNLSYAPGLRPGQGYATHVRGSSDQPILDLDFEDPARFAIEGLEPEPTVALTLGMVESQRFFELGARDGTRRGSSLVWRAPPWTLESMVAEASYRSFAQRFSGRRELHYDLGVLSPAASIVWNWGYVSVETVADLGPPPPPAYIWDLILDVAQRRLHDGGLHEGSVQPRIELPPLSIGFSAVELVEAMRTPLQQQREKLVAMMLGTSDKVRSRATLWLDQDRPALRVVAGAPRIHIREDLRDVGVEAILLENHIPHTYWVKSPEGMRYALIVGTWNEEAYVDVGVVAVPEIMQQEAP